MKLTYAFLILGASLAAQTLVGPRVPATGTYANRPSTPATNTVYIVTDDASAGACTGGGSSRSQCQWNGSAWVALGGSGGGGPVAPTFANTAVNTGVVTPADSWVMQEGSGTTFADSSGTANTVTAGGTVGWTAGPGLCGSPNTCAHFPGTFDSPSANSTNFHPSANSTFTLSTWVSFDGLGASELFLSQLNGAATLGWYLAKNSSDTLTFDMTGSSGGGNRITISSSHALTATSLYFIVVTYDGSLSANGVSFYYNGVGEATGTISVSTLSSMSQTNLIYLSSWAGGNQRHTGYQSGTRLYNRVLTGAEIWSLFSAGPVANQYVTATRTTEQVYASSFATLDCELATRAKIGGGTCTDNTAKINAVLATASAAAPLDLIIDGGTATTGLFVAQAGYTTLRGLGWGTGLYTLPGSNASPIANGYGQYPNHVTTSATTQPPARGANVIIKDMKIDGNRGTFSSGNSTHGDARGLPYILGIDISGVNGLLYDNLWIYDAPTYATNGANVGYVTVRNCKVESPSLAVNTDGVHFGGPANNIIISGLSGTAGDDLSALNSPEMYGGNIADVAISDVQTTSALHILRAYGFCTASVCSHAANANYTVSNVEVTNVSGTVTDAAATLFGDTNSGSRTAGILGPIKFSNWTLTGPAQIQMGDPFSELWVDHFTWLYPTSALPLLASKSGTTYTGGSLTITDSSIFRLTGTGNSAAYLAQIASATVKKMSVNNFAVVNASGDSTTAIGYLIAVPSGGAVTTLALNGNDPTNVTAPVNSGDFARITNVIGVIPWPLAIASLPTCTAAMEGTQGYINDSLATVVYLGTLTNGGSAHGGAYCNGTAFVGH